MGINLKVVLPTSGALATASFGGCYGLYQKLEFQKQLHEKNIELLKKDQKIALMEKDRQIDQQKNKHAIEKQELLHENKAQAKEINDLKNKNKNEEITLIDEDNLEEEPIY